MPSGGTGDDADIDADLTDATKAAAMITMLLIMLSSLFQRKEVNWVHYQTDYQAL